jgi:hypothetical protein
MTDADAIIVGPTPDTATPDTGTPDTGMPDRGEETHAGRHHGSNGSYWRFAAMIATSMAAMYALTYANTYRLGDVRWSEMRFYMNLLMGATMAVIMLGFMLGMYRNRTVNIAIIVGAVAVFGGSLWLVRSQSAVQDGSYMRAMIPHHSIAILTSSRAEIDDVRVRRLADEIIDAQKREIVEMEWLIDDIAQNGEATTQQEADARPAPEFSAADYDD